MSRSVCTVLFRGHGVRTDLEHLYRIYSNPTHDKHQWLLLQFIVLLVMDAKGVRNMQSIPVVVYKHNTVRVASCWFNIYHFIYFSFKFLILKKCTYIRNHSTNFHTPMLSSFCAFLRISVDLSTKIWAFASTFLLHTLFNGRNPIVSLRTKN